MAYGLKRQLVPNALIVLYHRVAEPPCDPQRLSVSPRHFADHLQVIKTLGSAVSVQHLEETRRQRRLAPTTLVVTFDDGYADSLHHAKPLLERHDVPATVFVSSGYVGQACEFWWDELERLMLHPGTLPEVLRLSVNGTPHEWPLGAESHYTTEAFERDRRWNFSRPQERVRQRAYLTLCRLLSPLTPQQRDQALDTLRTAAGVGPAGRPSHRALTPREVLALADGGLVEIGSHAVTHSTLSALPIASQREEIRQSRERLEEILGRPVSSFAYPFGTRTDYTSETVDAVRTSGFVSACSNFEGLVDRRTDSYQLPRHVVRDWDGDTFARTVQQWLCG
jgi:peptidoglycan/xylan/chitin deacetylase (PgdA/CDA1 family)